MFGKEKEESGQVAAGALRTFDVDWKVDKTSRSLPNCPCQIQSETQEELDPAIAAAGCFVELHGQNTYAHTYTQMAELQPPSVFQNVSLDVLAPVKQAGDSVWQTPPQQESSCHVDK